MRRLYPLAGFHGKAGHQLRYSVPGVGTIVKIIAVQILAAAYGIAAA